MAFPYVNTVDDDEMVREGRTEPASSRRSKWSCAVDVGRKVVVDGGVEKVDSNGPDDDSGPDRVGSERYSTISILFAYSSESTASTA